MTYDSVLAILRQNSISVEQWWDVLKYISTDLIDMHNLQRTRSLVIRCLERIDDAPEVVKNVIRDLLNHLGYYPYLARFKSLGVREALNFEFHRADGLSNVILHAEQFKVITALKNGESVILSAPTSFGKSLLIDEIVASRKFDNIVIIEPTLALIDETRSRLKKYDDHYKIIVSTAQSFGERNLLILTPERLVEISDLPPIDFFVIDEFYKLSPSRNDERANVLNHAFYRLLQYTRHFYLLGPRIASIPPHFTDEYECRFIRSTFETVASDYMLIKASGHQRLEQLMKLLATLAEPTLIYCQSPARAEKLARYVAETMPGLPTTNDHDTVVEWIQENIHPGWSLCECLRRGVAFHHGKLPRHLGKYLVKAFNEHKIRFLFCTSTLIEGVNTVAKNVVIFDRKKGSRKEIDYFDFANISGRSGRMGHYLVGRVFVFFDPPQPSDLNVDIPWYTQDAAADEILVQLKPEHLKDSSKPRVQPYLENPYLSIDVIRANVNVDPSRQVELARFISEHLKTLHPMLSWTQFPTRDQLYATCELLWRFLVVKGEANVFSGKQLAFIINRYRKLRTPAAIIRAILKGSGKSVDEAVQECMDQIRVWCEFRFPKLLLAVDAIQKEVFSKAGLEPGDYLFFATQVESGFIHPNLAALREFGVPIQVAAKLQPYIDDLSDLDHVIARIRSLDLRAIGFSEYEVQLLASV